MGRNITYNSEEERALAKRLSRQRWKEKNRESILVYHKDYNEKHKGKYRRLLTEEEKKEKKINKLMYKLERLRG